ncbi:MAG: hypothetical protein JXR37_29335 [Kiritimatiellae bacterium]|nr:hypothetical protein [Kiritimatiellia bacterium]
MNGNLKHMSPWGIGLKIGFVTLLYGLPATYLTFRFPGSLAISGIPFTAHAVAGLALGLVGATIYARSLCLLHDALRKGLLVTRGPYAVVRHPIYASWMFILLPAIALLLRSWLLLAAPALAYATFKVLAPQEDGTLESVFGRAYGAYARRVPELFPSFRRLRMPNRQVE